MGCFALWQMMHMPWTITLRTSEHDACNVVDHARLDNGNWIFPAILFSLDLLLPSGKAVAQWPRAGAQLIADNTATLVRRQLVLYMSKTNTSPALKDEQIVAYFRDQMISAPSGA